MAPRPTSWRDVAALSPTRGAPMRGYGLGRPGGWQGMMQFSPAVSAGGRGGTGTGRGQPNMLERAEAEAALEADDGGFNPFNAGGRALLKALDVLDTPRAFATAALYGERGLLSEDFDWDTVHAEASRNLTFGEATGTPGVAGFLGDVAIDPLTYFTGGVTRPGTAAGQSAARKFLEPSTKKFLGEQLADLAVKRGRTFADDAERAVYVAEEGTLAAERAAQKALKFRNNRVLTELEREAIGATPGTFVNLPGTGKIGRTLQIDRIADAVTGGRFTAGAKGRRAVRVTKREIPVSALASRASAKVRSSKVGDALAEVFTRYPTYRRKIVHGTPAEAAKAFLSLGARNRGTLQRRLFESTWGTKLEDLLTRAKKARVDGEDLWMAAGESADALGPATVRVESRAPGLAAEAKKFFEDIQTAANDIDPEFPWLASIADYTPRIPSDEVAAARASKFARAGGALRKETFDYKRSLRPGEELFDEKLVEPAVHAKNWSVEKQIDDILMRNGVPNWNQTDAFRAFPDYVRRLSTRYGEEFMAKTLRDLGIADVALKRVMSEKGVSQGQTKAAILKMITRARERARAAEREAAFSAGQAERFGGVEAEAEGMVGRAEGRRETAQDELRRRTATEPKNLPAVREWEQHNIEQAAKVATDREALLGRVTDASDDVLNLSHAEVEASQRVNVETHAAYHHVTELEASISDMYDELGEMYDRLQLLDAERVDYAAARKELDTEIPKLEDRVFGLQKKLNRHPAEDVYLDGARKRLAELKAAKDDPELFTVWAQENFTVTEVGGNTGRMDERLQETLDATTELEGRLAESEALLADLNEVALRPTEPLYEQLDVIDSELQPRLSERDGLVASGLGASEELMDQIETLANLKSSVQHEIGVVERAMARASEVTNPETIAQHLDLLRDAEAVGNNTIHAMFPELPPEVHGARVRQFMNDRMDELQRSIDETQDQVLSAFTDRDTVRVELDAIQKELRAAQRKLKQVRKDVLPEAQASVQMEASLLEKAEKASQDAIAMEEELAQLDLDAPQLVHDVVQADREVAAAQGFAASMHSKRLTFEARATRTEATAAGKRKTARVWEDIGKRNLDKEVDTVLQRSMNHSWHQLGSVSQVKEEWLLEGLKAATIMSGPESIRPSLRLYDKVLNMWKGYALSTPGTIMRNIFGGVFNNWLAVPDMKLTDYSSFMLAHKAHGTRAFDKLPKDIRESYEAVRSGGLLTGGGTSLEIERRLATGVSLKPWTPDFFYTRFFRAGQEEAENMLRGTLAMHTIRNGGTVDDAMDQVFKFHFDYDDLSAMERSVFRRIVPFYTWTRKNLPLMLEQIVKNPTAFTRFYQLKNEIELHSPQETVVPSYFAENMAVRMPFQLGGGQSYVLPDLPFTSINDVTDPSTAFSQMSPFIKTPIEYAFGKQFFKGLPLRDSYQPMPTAMSTPLRLIPGAVPLLEATGKVQRNADGSLAMKQKDLYVVEQFLPVYGKARRLFPSEQQYDDRMATTWMSWAFGIGLRTNTPQDRRNEASRRVRRYFERLGTQQELGHIPEWQKLPRMGQTINAAYEQLGVEKEEEDE